MKGRIVRGIKKTTLTKRANNRYGGDKLLAILCEVFLLRKYFKESEVVVAASLYGVPITGLGERLRKLEDDQEIILMKKEYKVVRRRTKKLPFVQL